MLFITNRRPDQSLKTRIGRILSFSPDKNDPQLSLYFCDDKEGEYEEVGSKAFLNTLKSEPHSQILFFIHGFNTPMERGLQLAHFLQVYFNDSKNNLVKVVPLIWPCDNHFGVLRDYYSDRSAAVVSGEAFARAVVKFLQWQMENEISCSKRLNLLCHSMGNYVMQQALYSLKKNAFPEGLPLLFRNIFMSAADIDNDALNSELGGDAITGSARNVVVYYASDDLAMRASKIANVGKTIFERGVFSRRMGHTGPEMSKMPKNVYAIDCDDFNTSYDSPNGHNYFIDVESGNEGLHFLHLRSAIVRGRVLSGSDRTYILNESKRSEILDFQNS